MSVSDKYKDFTWIKVKAWRHESVLTTEDNYAALQAHHEKETAFLTAEVRRLARFIDTQTFHLGYVPTTDSEDEVFVVQKGTITERLYPNVAFTCARGCRIYSDWCLTCVRAVTPPFRSL